MSSGFRPDTDFGNESAENETVLELISQLKSAFQPRDFDNVQQILTTREENMKRDIAHWKKEYESMEKKHGEMALTNIEIEDELNKYKLECDELREQITRLKEDKRVHFDTERVHCDRGKRAEERYAKLLEDYSKAENENRKLNLKASELDLAKNKAEYELETCKKRFEELSLRVLRLEDDTAILMREVHVNEKNKEELGAERPVSDELMVEKKNSDIGKSQYETAVGTVGENLASLQVKESSSNYYEGIHSLAGAGSATVSLEVGSNPLQEAGPHPVITACSQGKPIQNQLVFEKGCSNEVKNTPVACGGRTGSGVVIELSDSDDEMPTRNGTTNVPNVIASGFILSNKEIKSARSGQTGDERRRICTENCLLDSSTKRKRGSYTSIYESKNDDDIDDMTPISKRKTKALQELIMDGSDGSDSGDSSSSDSESSDIESVIAMLRRRNGNNKTWAFEVDMMSAFERDPELCMNAVCALYRQQLRKLQSSNGSLLTKNRGFNQFDALRGIALGEYLTDGDPLRKLNKSVSELQQHDPNGLDYCRKLAMNYSRQLFEIHQKKEDPFFLPP